MDEDGLGGVRLAIKSAETQPIIMISSNKLWFANRFALWVIYIAIGWCPEGWAAESGGFVVGWGDNLTGVREGMRLQDNKLVGTVVIGGKLLENVYAIASGNLHGVALHPNGTVAGWGSNHYEQSRGSETNQLGESLVVIKGQLLTNVIAVAGADSHTLAVKGDGTVTAWGGKKTGGYGEVNVPHGLSNVIAVAAGRSRSLALKRDGTVIGWGTRVAPKGLSNVVAIAVADLDFGYDLALRDDGSVVQWERNGTLVPGPTEATNVIAIAAGSSQSLALRNDGTVIEWRNLLKRTDIHPQITSMHPELTNIVAIAAAQMRCLALKKDGTVVAWGFGNMPVFVPEGLSNVAAISTAQNFSLAITTNRAVADLFRY
jgi:alpha-tubulin suppressor-like RCC1 family protein